MKAPSIKAALTALAAAYPDTVFTLEPGRRGVRYITWTGGPHAAEVHQACHPHDKPFTPLPQKTGFHRHDTPEELAEKLAQWDREDAERLAAKPARRAAAKAAGAAKRAKTIARRRTILAALAARFGDIVFSVTARRGAPYVEWTGGPAAEQVAAAAGVAVWQCARTMSDPERADAVAKENADRARETRREAARTPQARHARLHALEEPQRFAAHARPRRPQLWLPLRMPRDWRAIGGYVAGPVS